MFDYCGKDSIFTFIIDTKYDKRNLFIYLQYSGSLKQSGSGRNNYIVELKAYPPDRRLCCITDLKEYLKRTETLRKNQCSLFISYVHETL